VTSPVRTHARAPTHGGAFSSARLVIQSIMVAGSFAARGELFPARDRLSIVVI
jgi:hypothetical protein